MNATELNKDKAGKTYWDTTERNQRVEMQAFDPRGNGVRNFGKRMWHKAFLSALGGIPGEGKKLLELGCGGSALLPYFAREFGFHPYGMDYSEQGCDLARKMCGQYGVSAQIICADFFHAPPEYLGQFDVVTSFGVVEHFTDTAHTLSTFAEFLKPGGLMITTVPNMDGLVGLAQNFLAKDVFEKHVVIRKAAFRSAHESAGLIVEQCGYLLFTNFGVVNPGRFPALHKTLFLDALKIGTGLSWMLESVAGPFPSNRFSSPYLLAVARKRPLG